MALSSFTERLKNGEMLVCDGALGTMLMQMGMQPGGCPEALNLTDPDKLAVIARQYADAGADLVTTNTFGGSPLKLGDYGLSEKTDEINREAVRIVRDAVGDSVYITASCGPTGRILLPYGDTEHDVVREGYRRQLTALIEAGTDIICVETMIDLQEAVIAVETAKELSPETPVMATMTFDETPRGFFSVMGVDIPAAVSGLEAAGADVVGSNCGNGLEKMIMIARECKKSASVPVIIQSNAGLPELKNGKTHYSESAGFFAEKIPELIDIGVAVIGGCCGTTPDHIRAIRALVDARAI